jgi:hypothetical protein
MSTRVIHLPTSVEERPRAAAPDAACRRQAPTQLSHSQAELPPAPRHPQDTGLPVLLLTELLLKVMHQHGLQHCRSSQHLKLGPALLEEVFLHLRKEMLAEVRLRGVLDGDVTYELTHAGRARAADALARNLYSGPAPVPIGAYADRVRTQSVSGMSVTKDRLEQVLADVAMSAELRDQLGAAMNSQRAILLYGPPGAGKTFLCEQMARLLTGDVAVPYAVEVGGEIIRGFDPLVHRPARARRALA